MATLVAGELYYGIDGQLAEIKRQMRQPEGYPFDPEQLKTALQNVIEGKFGGQSPVPRALEPPWLSVIATTELLFVEGKPTKSCFVDQRRWAFRDADFDNRLSAQQRASGPCMISTIGFAKGWTFAEAAAKIACVGAGTSVKLLGQVLIAGGHTITLSQGEEMVEATERGIKTEMRVDGYGNFFFVETGNEDNPVSVAGVDRDGSQWYADVFRLGRGSRWGADYRLLVRNLDALTL